MVFNPNGIMFINLFLGICSLVLFFVITLPKSKKYQDYLYDDYKINDYAILIIIILLLWIFLMFLFRIPTPDDISLVEDYKTLFDGLKATRTLLIPFWLQIFFLASFFGQILFIFVYYSNKLPTKYLQELNNINKFTTFILYNIEYYNNDRHIVYEALSGIEKDSFYNDLVSLYELEIPVEEKFKRLTNVYSFKFLYMFLKLFLITLDKGKSEQSLTALDHVKKTGDSYYKHMTNLFKAKQSSLFVIYFINIMMIVMLLVILKSLGIGFSYFMYDNYLTMLLYFSFIVGLLSYVSVKYKNNKLIYKEGRYV